MFRTRRVPGDGTHLRRVPRRCRPSIGRAQSPWCAMGLVSRTASSTTAVSQVAARLAASGLTPGDRVVLVADNSADHLIVAFAVWRAGATLVTIYPSSSGRRARLRHRERRTGARDRRLPGRRRRAPGGHRCFWRLVAAGGGARTDPEPSSASPGSTIAPEVRPPPSTPRRWPSSATRRARRRDRRRSCTPTQDCSLRPCPTHGCGGSTSPTRRSSSLPLAWAFGLVTTSMATLTAGGRVVILARAEPGQMLRSMAADRATFFAGVTTMFVKLVDALEETDDPPDLSSLRLCISGGEPRNEVGVRTLVRRSPGARSTTCTRRRSASRS